MPLCDICECDFPENELVDMVCHDCWTCECGGELDDPRGSSQCRVCRLVEEVDGLLGCCNDCANGSRAQEIVAEMRAMSSFDDEYECYGCGDEFYGVPYLSTIGDTLRYAINRPVDEPVYCPACYDMYVQRGRRSPEHGDVVPYRINNYSFKPTPEFRKTKRDLPSRTLYYGTEIEVEMSPGASSRTALCDLSEHDTQRLFYCKSDSSISNGFEVVSHPFTLAWMHENEDAFEPLFNLSKRMYGHDAENCGMHVHMSLDAFTNLQLMKFMRFIYTNKSFVHAVSRRQKERLERWASLENVDDSTIMRVAKVKGRSRSRGTAVNITGSTAEIRIFRSTLSKTVYFGNIEFLECLFDFTALHGMRDMTPDKLVDFAHDRAKAYKNFLTLESIVNMNIENEEDGCV